MEAGYNAAIIQEALGNLSKAEKMMTEVYNANPDSRVAKGLADIQYEIWRDINDHSFLERTMLIAAEAHPEYEYILESHKSPDGENMYRIK